MASVRPKKHLGQHFLKDENIARKIVEALDGSDSRIIEIGPGTGVLTQHLIHGESFEAMDVDTESIAFLKKQYPDQQHKIIEQDFLKTAPWHQSISVIGNFPYNISSQIFFKIWDNRHHVKEVVGMVQKEVGERIVSPHGSKVYGILSVLIQAFYDVEYLFTVPPSVFQPPPKVQSAVIRLRRNEVEHLDCDEALFKRVVKEGFGKRRKTLRNALKALFLPGSDTDDERLNARAEQLTVNDFVHLTKMISENGTNSV